MGKDQLQEKKLRQVNISVGPQTAVSETMSVSSFALTDISQNQQGMNIAAPVMKSLGNIAGIPAAAPDIAMVEEAHEELEVKLSSNSRKREKEMEAVSQRYTAQGRLVHQLQDPNKRYNKTIVADAYAHLVGLDLSSYMKKDKDTDSYKDFIAKYSTLKCDFQLLDDYQAAINQKQANIATLDEDQKKELMVASAKLKTLYDIRAYYEVRENLMSNRYYSLVPPKEAEKLSYKELRFRLNKLYADQNKDDKKKALIDFYQNLIRLKELDLSDAKSVKDRQLEYLKESMPKPAKADTRDPKDEMKKITASFFEISETLDSKTSLMDKDACLDRFFRVFGKDIDAFEAQVPKKSKDMQKMIAAYNRFKTQAAKPADKTRDILSANTPAKEKPLDRSDDSSDGINLSPELIEGVRLIGGWLLRHGSDNPSLIFNLLQAPPEQQLLIFYLIENEKEESASKIDYFSALHNYEPDLNNFKAKATTSIRKKLKLDNISKAMRASMSISTEMQGFAALNKEVTVLEQTVKDNKANGALDITRKANISLAIQKKGALLKTLYLNAGLSPEMPPDMAEDPVLRKKLFKEFKDILGLVQELSTIDATKEVSERDYTSHMHGATGQEVEGDQEESDFETHHERYDAVDEYIVGGVGELGDGLSEAIGFKKMHELGMATTSNVFDIGIGAFGTLSGLFGFVGAALQAHSIRTSADELTKADHVAQSIDVTGDFIESVGGILTGVGGIAEAVEEGAQEITSWIGESSEAVWNAASPTTGAYLAAAGGGIAVIAGAVKTTASAIHLGRGYSNLNDVKEAKKAARSPGNTAEENETLDLFLKHQEGAAEREMASAGVGVVTGIMTSVAGGLIMSGYLTPIGAIVGLTSLAIEFSAKGIGYLRKNSAQKSMVDEYLGVSTMVRAMKNDATHPRHAEINKMNPVKLQERVRKEALAMLGFNSHQECFKHICTQMATLIYNKVFSAAPGNEPPEFFKAMSSLGMKIERGQNGEPNKPSVAAMVAKMMEQ